MPLILAVDRDTRQTATLAALVREHVAAEICQAASADEALAQLSGRVPDLILTSPLLPAHDDERLAAHMRRLGNAAVHVQALRIPALGAARPPGPGRGVLARLRGSQASPGDRCDPALFAGEITSSLARAREARQRAADDTPKREGGPVQHPPGAGDGGNSTGEEIEMPPMPLPDAALLVEDAGSPEPAREAAFSELDEAPLALELDWILAESLALETVPDHAPPAPAATRDAASGTATPTRPPEADRLGPEKPPGVKADHKPPQDEWGVYDPEQCGFAALLAKLERRREPDEQDEPEPPLAAA